MKIRSFGVAGLIVVGLSTSIVANAQTSVLGNYSDRSNNYDSIDSRTPGKIREIIHTLYGDGKEYKIELVNNKLSKLWVDQVTIPESNFGNYKEVIGKIREQIAMDKKDLEKAHDNQPRSNKPDQGTKDQDQVQSHNDQSNVKRNPDNEVMKGMVDDLVKDGIVPDHKSLLSVTLSSAEMTVNEKKQPDAIFARYRRKYNAWATNNFSYGGSKQSYQGFHLRWIEGL